MGREVRRVPLDFNWPIDKVWKGFVNPYYRPCPSPDCRNGQTIARARLEDIVRLISISAHDAGCVGRSHPYFYAGTFISSRGDVPGKDLLELTKGIEKAGQKIGAHTLEWTIEKTLMTMAGLDPDTWGMCPICHGENIDPALQEQYEKWECQDPPSGEGWQMWETVSEGSPISPVFATPEKLAQWLADTGASTFGSMTAPYDVWLKMIVGSGWAPSAVALPGVGLVSGVYAATITDDDKPAQAHSTTEALVRMGARLL